MDMIHYILVRRDLPFGATLAQVAHAAQVSSYGYHTVCVLGVRDEKALRHWAKKLVKKEVSFTVCEEPDLDHQATAIGVWPDLRTKLQPIFKKLMTYKDFQGTV